VLPLIILHVFTTWLLSIEAVLASIQQGAICILRLQSSLLFHFILRTFSNSYNIYTFLKVKVKLSLEFNWAPRHESVLGEWSYNPTHSLTSALDGDEWSASRPGRSTFKERTPSTHWTGGWVGSRAVLDVVAKRKIPSSRRESNPRTPIVQSVTQRYTVRAITALKLKVQVKVTVKLSLGL
jgi:hypothetical protein